jgi:hypothetical protein
MKKPAQQTDATRAVKTASRKRSFADFRLMELQEEFRLKAIVAKLFVDVPEQKPSAWLVEALAAGQLSSLVTEKARSEFLVAPLLVHVRQQLKDKVSLYSGVALDVDADRGLRGVCDFVFSKGQQLPDLSAPVCVLVEAKKNDIELGIGQCVAEMLAAQIFNQQHGTPQQHIYGCVTTGESWQFLQLTHKTLTLEDRRYFIHDAAKLLGIFTHILS